MQTPILLIAWRRPHTIHQVIDAIRPIAPTRLFIACDGPSFDRPGEVEKVAATRSVIDQEIDWPCQIERLGVSRAITWFFDHVEEGIILEDDCVPHPDFFSFSSTLLQRYRYDTRIWCISGNNFQDGLWRGDGSYYFSRYNHCWGWASWRRCWRHYDSDLSQFLSLRNSGLLSTIFEDPVEQLYWSKIWQRLLDINKPDSWAYRWTFTCLVNGGLTALPNRNLVNNVGFGDDATNTAGKATDTTLGMGIDPGHHPSFILRNKSADRYTFDSHFGGKWYRLPRSLFRQPREVASKIKRAVWDWIL